ncbi:uncharacterized protein K02A2.6-like [Planococcus citri]|uniref:uncharacterized protein K02A2.6-like n=1 Tax=Planococcus citri TaxID=170843 RepID=UPI0031F7D2C7
MDEKQLKSFIAAMQKSHEESTQKLINELKTQFQAQPQPSASGTSDQITRFEKFNSKVEVFTSYIERFKNHLKLINLTDTVKQASLLCESIGAEHYNQLAAFLGPEKRIDTLQFEDLISKFTNLLQSKKSPVLAQHQFFQCYQSENQSIAEYVAQLQKALIECDFHVMCKCPTPKKLSISDSFLRPQFIRGIRDNAIRAELLKLNKTEFNDYVTKAMTLESSKIESKTLAENQSNSTPSTSTQSTTSESVNKLHQHQSRQRSNDRNSKRSTYRSNLRPSNYHQTRSKSNSDYRRKKVNFRELGIDQCCLRCGYDNHLVRDCKHPAEKFKCDLCSKTGHVKKVCISSLIREHHKKKSESNVSYVASDDDDTIYSIYSIHSIHDGEKRIMIPVQINGKKCTLECDTGSKKTLVLVQWFKKLKLKEKLQQDNTVFRDFTQNIFRPLGYCNVKVKYKDREINEKMYVTDKSTSSVIGLNWLLPLKIVQIDDIQLLPDESVDKPETQQIINELKAQFPDVFEPSIGKVADFTARYELKEGTIPIYRPAKKVPYALLPKIDKAIDNYVRQGIFTQVETSEWGTPAVYTEKRDGSIRICGNYKITINDRVQDVRYTIPPVQEVFMKLKNGKYYCKVDIRDAYLHLLVDDLTARIQALTTHRGVFIVHRLFFGGKPAPSIFHEFIKQIVQDLEGTEAYFDDIIVEGETIEECRERLFKLFRKLQEKNLHVNEKKCVFFSTRIEYLGHIITSEGIAKSPEKVKAIKQAPTPKTIRELRSFLGMVNHYHKFIDDAATLLKPLNELQEKERDYKWTNDCENSFNAAKEILASDQVLVPYNINLPVILETDASPVGISAILSHSYPDGTNRPIEYASRTLSKTESRYSQIDREAHTAGNLRLLLIINLFSKF